MRKSTVRDVERDRKQMIINKIVDKRDKLKEEERTWEKENLREKREVESKELSLVLSWEKGREKSWEKREKLR